MYFIQSHQPFKVQWIYPNLKSLPIAKFALYIPRKIPYNNLNFNCFSLLSFLPFVLKSFFSRLCSYLLQLIFSKYPSFKFIMPSDLRTKRLLHRLSCGSNFLYYRSSKGIFEPSFLENPFLLF